MSLEGSAHDVRGWLSPLVSYLAAQKKFETSAKKKKMLVPSIPDVLMLFQSQSGVQMRL